jgi:hypothetical protein
MADANERTGINLQLTEREAKVLLAVINKVGGSPQGSYRRETVRIADALNAVLGDEVSPVDSGLDPDVFDVSDGYIHMDKIE